MPNFKIIGHLVLEMKSFKCFYHIIIMGVVPFWPCDLDNFIEMFCLFLKEAACRIWLCFAQQFTSRRCWKINGHKHAYSPGTGATNPLGPIFHNQRHSKIRLCNILQFFTASKMIIFKCLFFFTSFSYFCSKQ